MFLPLLTKHLERNLVWLPESVEHLRDAPGFEKYLNSPVYTKPENLKTDIYIPIK